MGSAAEETAKRLRLAGEFAENARESTLGIIMVGSVAYAANENVREDSDLDLVVVYQNVKDSIPVYFKNDSERDYLLSQDYDGFLAKRKMEGVPVSIHNIGYGTLQKISEAEYTHLEYYRQAAKDVPYYSVDFDGVSHEFRVESVPVAGQMGVKRIDPIAFERDGKFVIGNDIDKLLSAGTVLHDTDGLVEACMQHLWHTIALRMAQHYTKANKSLDIVQADITPSLCRSARFSCTTQDNLKQRTQESLLALRLG